MSNSLMQAMHNQTSISACLYHASFPLHTMHTTYFCSSGASRKYTTLAQKISLLQNSKGFSHSLWSEINYLLLKRD